MKNYDLSIELSFFAEDDARDIMEACTNLQRGVDPEKELSLYTRLEEQSSESIANTQAIVKDALHARPKIPKLLEEASSLIGEMQQVQQECEVVCLELEKKANDLRTKIKSEEEQIDSRIYRAKELIENIYNGFASLDNAIRQAQDKLEACSFIRDMNKVTSGIITKGKIILSKPDDLGNPSIIDKWEYGD